MKKIIYLSLAIIIFIASSVVIFIVLNKDATITPPPIIEYEKPTNPYGWEYLNDWQKELYKVIESGTLQVNDTYDLDGEKKLEDVKFVIDLYYQNIPFRDIRTYTPEESMKLVTDPTDNSLTYSVGLGTASKIKVSKWGNFNVEESLRKLAAADKKADEIISSIPKNANDYEKIKIIYDYLINNVLYDSETLTKMELGLPLEESDDGVNAYGALINNKAICDGIAEAFQYVATKAGIYSLYVTSVSRNHAWNIVWIDGKYYRLDATGRIFLTYDDYNGDFVDGIPLPSTKHDYK